MSEIELREQTVRGSVLNRLVPIGYEEEAFITACGLTEAKMDGGVWNMQPGGPIVLVERGAVHLIFEVPFLEAKRTLA